MPLKYLSELGLKEPKMVALSVGVGSGTKLFHSLLDSHPEIYMIPGYPLMYFYPFWHKILKQKKPNWEMIVDELFRVFPSIFNTSIDPGGETLNHLGTNNDETIIVNIDLFKKYFLLLTKNEVISTKNCLIAIHIAYALAKDEELSNNKIIIFHIHLWFYVTDYLFKDFPDLKVIAAVRDPRPNIRRRESNSILNANERRLRKSDSFLMKQRAYRQIIRFATEGLDSKYPIKLNNVRVFLHEDLALRLKSVMANTAKFLDIRFHNCLLNPTFGGLIWKTTYYDFDTSNIVNPAVLSNKWKKIEPKREIIFIEGICLDYIEKYYNSSTLYYKSDKLLNLFLLIIIIILPTRIEMLRIYELMRLDKYLRIIYDEIKNINFLQSYKKNLFYQLKWTNDGINFSRQRFYELFSITKEEMTRGISLRLFFLKSTYLIDRLVAYSLALVFIPINLFFRIRISMRAVIRRLMGKRYLPEIL